VWGSYAQHTRDYRGEVNTARSGIRFSIRIGPAQFANNIIP
jgi:hypothetical protein